MFGINSLWQEIRSLGKMLDRVEADLHSHKNAVPAGAHQKEAPRVGAAYPSGPGMMGRQAFSSQKEVEECLLAQQRQYYAAREQHDNSCRFCGAGLKEYSESVKICPGCGLIWATAKFRELFSLWERGEELKKQMTAWDLKEFQTTRGILFSKPALFSGGKK